MQTYFMLDTNSVSYVLKGTEPHLQQKLTTVPMAGLCISSITEAELLYGLAKRGNLKGLQQLVHEFLIRVDVIPWESTAALAYANLRTQLESSGLMLGNLDMLIAAHALSINATLVTHDQAFFKAKHLLQLADWTKP